jgi:D-glycero-alpha-D-manno-heptose-7-phosphate kinase
MCNGGKAAKVSGAGGGGFLMILCDPVRRYELIKALIDTEGTVVPAEFTEKGAQAWKIYRD